MKQTAVLSAVEINKGIFTAYCISKCSSIKTAQYHGYSLLDPAKYVTKYSTC